MFDKNIEKNRKNTIDLVNKFCAYLFITTSLFFSFSALAQPCLSGWKYRQPIYFTNVNNNDLSGFQAKFILNTQNLIANGKLNIDGSDLRILDSTGSVLPYWIETNTINKTTTSVWVKIPNILANSTITCYLFYGNSSASSFSNGDNTFEFFDDFDGSTLNTLKWTSCGSGKIQVSNNTLILTSTTTGNTDKALISSNTSFNVPVRVESYLSNFSGSGAYIGIKNIGALNNGYALFYEFLSGTGYMKMRLIDNSNFCASLSDQSPSTNAVPAYNILGLWSLTWVSTGLQNIDWAGATTHPITRNESQTLTNNQQIFIANGDKAGESTWNWIRVRKYANYEVSSKFGIETSLITSLIVTNSGAVCEGGNLSLGVNGVENAIYNWIGPLGFTSSLQYPSISGISLNQAGTYQVSLSIPSDCFVYTSNTVVTVNSNSFGGTAIGDTNVCSINNSGIISLSGMNGKIIRWETSATGNQPWTTIQQTSSTISYKNLISNSYYRTVVKNGACAEDYSNSVLINVSPNSNGGKIVGASFVCEGLNQGSISIIQYTGNVIKWQSSTDNFSTVSNINYTGDAYIYQNLNQTTQFRAFIQSGVCNVTTSSPVTIHIYPKPKVSFSSNSVCQGNTSVFINNTTISSGRVTGFSWDFGDGNSSSNKNVNYTYKNSNNYTVKLYATSNMGCQDSVTNQVNINPSPTTVFSAANVCDKSNVSFINKSYVSNGNIVKNIWKLGDKTEVNTTLTGNLLHLFSTPGTYLNKLITISDNGCADSTIQSVTVYNRAKVNFIASDVCIGNITTFINKTSISQGGLKYFWDFDNNLTDSTTNPSVLYTSPGTYLVNLIAKSDNNCTDSYSSLVNVFTGPEVNFQVENVCLLYPSIFENLSTVSSGIITYNWSFGNGQTSKQASPTIYYGNSGSFDVSLTVSTENNCVGTFKKTTQVYPKPIVNYVVKEVCDKDSVKFSNQSFINSGSLAYIWKFGDNQSFTGFNCNHLYPSSGYYQSKLLAISNQGCIDSLSQNIFVYPLPASSFVAPPVCLNNFTNFKNTSTINSGTIVSNYWNFSDGTNSIEFGPKKKFTAPGLYSVNLLSISDKGCRKDTTQKVEIYNLPKANFSVSDVCVFDKSYFTNLSQINSSEQLFYLWNFLDSSSTTTVTNPSHIFNKSSVPQSVQLLTTSQHSCKDSIMKTLNVYPLPVVSAGNDTTISQGYSVVLHPKGAEKYIWYPSTGLDNSSSTYPLAKPFETTVYSVVGIDKNNCVNISKGVTIFIEKDFKLMVSNVMTPDGDGVNDTWYVENIESFPEAEVSVYDIWGKNIFKKTSYQNDWTGTNNNDILPDGTYYYFITYPASSKTYKGAITIFRNKH
jgi:gliding motility-associated-like protein